MLGRLLFALLGFAPFLLAAQSQTVIVYDPSKYILVDARTLRGSFGYTSFGISDVDTLPDRQGQGLDVRIEGRLVSSFRKKKEGFVIADAFFLDLTLGVLSSEQLYYFTSPESRFSTAAAIGYSFLAGYSDERFGILGGKEVLWSTAIVGGTELPGPSLFTFTAPWMARLEFRPGFSQEFRIMVTGWDNFNNAKRTNGFRVDIPFLPKKRFFLTYTFTRASDQVSYASFDNYQYAPGTFTQHMIGLRFGSIY
ncbi:MAG: hypothetical protein IPO87_18205 [Flavobacteriales bacterium]|nr:hypothetical protein [Flavobacteriales bacterium]